MAIDINGAILPNVPVNVLVRYPSAVILKMTSGDTTVYALLAATDFFGHATKSIISSMEYEEMLGSLGAGRAYYAQAGASVWEVGGGEVAAGAFMLPVGTVDSSTITLVWANHDVLEITSLDTSTGDYTTDGVYFAQTADTSTGTGNNDASIYRIRRSRLAGIGDQVRRLTEVSPDLTPEEIEAMLAELDITLEEAYVTPTTEQQEIYPSAYGFSKIIVEAVEDSGSSGGGTGEGGDDSGDVLLPADGVGFGDIIEESTVLTYGGVQCPDLVDDGNTYKVIARTNDTGETFLFTSTGSWMYSSYNNGVYTKYRVTSNGTQTKYALGDGWGTGETFLQTLVVENDHVQETLYTILYTTHDIADKVNGGVWMAGMQPEETTTIVRTPVEHDETYTIDGNTVNDLAVIAQKITGTNDTLTPAEAAKALEEYYASLNPETTE